MVAKQQTTVKVPVHQTPSSCDWHSCLCMYIWTQWCI